jgi:hypothetical protein
MSQLLPSGSSRPNQRPHGASAVGGSVEAAV